MHLAPRLGKAAESAVADGLDFLETAVEPDGTWRCAEIAPTEPPVVMPSVFPAAVGVLALSECGGERAKGITSRSRRFIASRIEYPGVWRFGSRYPLDLDDSALSALAIGPRGHLWIGLERNLAPILARRDDEGRFLTWMTALGPLERPNDVCPVVNANVVAYLGDRPETHGAQRYVERLLRENGEDDASIWYRSSMDLYYAVSRAGRLAAPVFRAVRRTVADRIRETRLENDLVAAQALSSLCMLGERPSRRFARRCVGRLLEARDPGRGWEECEFSRGPRGVPNVFVSRALTTVCCIEALTRFLESR